jgi:hypothetical protein
MKRVITQVALIILDEGGVPQGLGFESALSKKEPIYSKLKRG